MSFPNDGSDLVKAGWKLLLERLKSFAYTGIQQQQNCVMVTIVSSSCRAKHMLSVNKKWDLWFIDFMWKFNI